MFYYIDLPLTADETTLLQYLLANHISFIRHIELKDRELSISDLTEVKLAQNLLNLIRSIEHYSFNDRNDNIENNLEQETE